MLVNHTRVFHNEANNKMEEPSIASETDKENFAYDDNANKEDSQPADEPRGAAVKKKVASFPEGECYELLLMDIVDRHSAHLPPRGEKGKHWTMVVADFNATTGPNVSKLNDWRPVQRKYIQIRCAAKIFQKSLLHGTVTEEDCSETMTKAYNIANDHLLEESTAKESEESAKRKIYNDTANQVDEGRALRLKSATRIVAGQVVQVGGPSMVLGDNGEVVNLDSDEESAVGQVMATPAAKKIRRTNSDATAAGGSSGNKSLCRDLITTLTQARQLNVDMESKRLDFEKQQAEKKDRVELHRIELEKSNAEQKHAMQKQQLEFDRKNAEQKHAMEQQQLEIDREERRQRFELEREDRKRQHELMLQNLELQTMQMEVQLADVKIRLAQTEQSLKERHE
jgi:hypothetical protein